MRATYDIQKHKSRQRIEMADTVGTMETAENDNDDRVKTRRKEPGDAKKCRETSGEKKKMSGWPERKGGKGGRMRSRR
jgi:hypothetical protein